MTKHVFGVSDQGGLKLACSAGFIMMWLKLFKRNPGILMARHTPAIKETLMKKDFIVKLRCDFRFWQEVISQRIWMTHLPDTLLDE